MPQLLCVSAVQLALTSSPFLIVPSLAGMRRSTANGHHSDNSLGSFCPLPDVDDDEARAPPTVALPSRKKQKVDARALRKRQDENLRKAKDNYLREEQLQTENERLKDRLRELEGAPRDNTARTRSLEDTCARQQAAIDTQALGSAYWADKVQWKKALSASADGGESSVDDDGSAASRQKAPGPSQGKPRPRRPSRRQRSSASCPPTSWISTALRSTTSIRCSRAWSASTARSASASTK